MNDECHDDGTVRCVFCGSRNACEHLLLSFDDTFGSIDGGIVEREAFQGPVARAFATALREGTSPNWRSN